MYVHCTQWIEWSNDLIHSHWCRIFHKVTFDFFKSTCDFTTLFRHYLILKCFHKNNIPMHSECHLKNILSQRVTFITWLSKVQFSRHACQDFYCFTIVFYDHQKKSANYKQSWVFICLKKKKNLPNIWLIWSLFQIRFIFFFYKSPEFFFIRLLVSISHLKVLHDFTILDLISILNYLFKILITKLGMSNYTGYKYTPDLYWNFYLTIYAYSSEILWRKSITSSQTHTIWKKTPTFPYLS